MSAESGLPLKINYKNSDTEVEININSWIATVPGLSIV